MNVYHSYRNTDGSITIRCDEDMARKMLDAISHEIFNVATHERDILELAHKVEELTYGYKSIKETLGELS